MNSQPSLGDVSPIGEVKKPDTGESSAISHDGIFSKARGLLLMAFSDPSLEERFLSQHRDYIAQYLRWVSLLCAAITLGLMWQDSIMSASGYKATAIRIYGVLPVTALAWYLSGDLKVRRFMSYIIAFFWLISTVFTISIFLVFEPGPYGLTSSAGGGTFLLILFGVFAFSNMRFWGSLLLGILLCLIYVASVASWTKVDFFYFFMGDFLNALCIVIVGATKNLFAERAQRRHFLISENLEYERERYKNLLFTLVPSHIASRIQAGEFPIVDSHAEVTILFADIVGFTALTRDNSPRMLIKVLNELFFEFDQAAEECSVEKIKTIGDGYMAVCGPPIDEDQRSVAVVELAKEMFRITRRVADKSGLPIKLRVGIHSGSLIAGVIGKNRFTYDVWGESVNLASRMESTGIADRIQISEAAYLRLRSHYPCQERDTIEVNGVGLVKRYLLAIANNND